MLLGIGAKRRGIHSIQHSRQRMEHTRNFRAQAVAEQMIAPTQAVEHA